VQDSLGIIEGVPNGEGEIINASDTFIVVVFIIVRRSA
jgi:hypothetical protein